MLKNKHNKYDTAVDIWSLGIAIIFMNTGGYPYTSTTQLGVIMEMTKGKPQTLKKSSKEMRNFVNNHCLQKNPRHRYTAEKALSLPMFDEFHSQLNQKSQKNGSVRPMIEYYNEFRYKLSQKEETKTDDKHHSDFDRSYPNKKRFCVFVDRRSDKMIFFEVCGFLRL